MKRATHQPCLHERLVFPQSRPHVPDLAFDADADLQLGAGHQLRLRSTDVADHARQVFLWRTLGEVMAGEPKGVHLRPAQLGGDGRLAFHDNPQ
jgi:hypothetical protein